MGRKGADGTGVEVMRRSPEWRPPRVADLAVPAALTLFQFFAVPWLATMADEPLDQRQRLLSLGLGVAACVVLGWRRGHPDAVLGTVLAINLAAGLTLPASATLTVAIAICVALFSQAVHRRGRIAAAGCLVASVIDAAVLVVPATPHAAQAVTDAAMGFLTYLAVTSFGALRRQRLARRQAITDRLDEAARERRAVAAAERERLTRDLHDIAGHHLSAIAVHSAAAKQRADPELTTEALTVAADTGRHVLSALSRLVDLVEPQPHGTAARLASLLPPLCAGVSRLGIPVSLEVRGGTRVLPPEITTAVFRVVQESLTNVVRYAAGAKVTVRVVYAPGAVEVVVRNEATPANAVPLAMGGGRGIAGMRERAEALGGTLSAGPDRPDRPHGPDGPDGPDEAGEAGETDVGSGWTVRGTFPLRLTAPGRWQWPEILDALTAAFGVTLPLAVVFTPPAMMAVTPMTVLPAVVLLIAHAAPLLWRRRRPFLALAAVMGVDVTAASGALLTSTEWLEPLALAWMVEMVAVYSVAAYDRNRLRAASGPLVAGATAGIIAAAAFVAYPEPSPAEPAATAVVAILIAGVVTLGMAAFWVWGAAVRRRRMRGLAWERDALEAIAARTWEVLRVERHRVAAGLRGAVLEHTARLVRAAESALARPPATSAARSAAPGRGDAPAGTPGRVDLPETSTREAGAPAALAGEADAPAALAEVADQARLALNGMRELLDMMEERA